MADYVVETKPAIIDQDQRLMLKSASSGLLLGVAVWVIAFVLENYILRAFFCNDPGAAACVNITTYSGNIAAVIAALIGLVTLVRLSIFRPLLIVLGAAISLWGLAAWLADLHVVEQIIWSIVLYALFYSLYTWIARIRNPVVVLIVFAVVAVSSRIIPSVI